MDEKEHDRSLDAHITKHAFFAAMIGGTLGCLTAIFIATWFGIHVVHYLS